MKPGLLWRTAAAWDLLRGRDTRRTRSIYAGASGDRTMMAWVSSCLAPDEEIRGDIRIMRGRARQLARDSAFVERYLQLLSDNVIGSSGIRIRAQYRDGAGNLDRALNSEVEGWWADLIESPFTIDGKLDFAGASDLALTSCATDGEALPRIYRGVGPFGIAVGWIDADLLEETHNVRGGNGRNEIRLGVEVTEGGRPVRYWIRQDPRYVARNDSGRFEPIDARDLLHVGRGRRVNQTRYVTWLYPVMHLLHQLDSYIESELVASRIGSNACGVWEDKDPKEAGADTTSSDQPANAQRLEAEPGMFLDAPPGKQLKEWAPGHPTDAFNPFVMELVRQIASGLGVSFASLANNVSEASYSNERTSLLKERDRWMKLQDWWIRAWQRPLFEAALEMAVLKRLLPPEVLPEPGRRPPVLWAPRRWQWVDPKDDAETRIMMLRHNLTSHQRIHAELGTDLEEILEEKKKAQELAEEFEVELEPAGPPAPGAAPPAGSSNGNGDGSPKKPATARGPRSRLPAGA